MSKDYPFGFDKPEDSLGFLLWKIMTLWQRQIKDELFSYDISHTQFVVIAMIFWLHSTGEHVIQNLIALRSGLDKMTVSKSLKILVNKKLIKRVECEKDTRAKQVELTTNGKKLLNKIVPKVEEVDSSFFNCLSQTEKKQLSLIFKKLVKND